MAQDRHLASDMGQLTEEASESSSTGDTPVVAPQVIIPPQMRIAFPRKIDHPVEFNSSSSSNTFNSIDSYDILLWKVGFWLDHDEQPRSYAHEVIETSAIETIASDTANTASSILSASTGISIDSSQDATAVGVS